jgi:nicotinamidase-related amidase
MAVLILGLGLRSEELKMTAAWALFDVDTRERFGAPDGPVFRKRAQIVRPQVEQLLEAAGRSGVPVVATACANPACVPLAGELGPSELWVPQDHCEHDWAHHLQGCRFVLFEKRTAGSVEANIRERVWETFSRNGNAAQVVRELNAQEWAVFGHSAEYCVATTVRGLLALGCSVTILSDAVVAFAGTVEGTRGTLEKLRSEGTHLETVEAFLRRHATTPACDSLGR